MTITAVMLGCQQGSTPTTPSPGTGGGNLTGTWSGTASDSSGPGEMSWQITQSGGSVTGTFTMTDTATKVGGRGALTGTVGGSSLQFTLRVAAGGFDAPYASCTSEVTGEAQFSASEINGAFSGSNSCAGPVIAGQVALTKR